MKLAILSILAVVAMASCRTVEPPSISCTFRSDTLAKGPDGAPMLDDRLDSMRTYTYQFEVVDMDSLLGSLCTHGFPIADGYYVDGYLCADARGPRPVVVLSKTDDRILAQGFWKGSNGRLACAERIIHYWPK